MRFLGFPLFLSFPGARNSLDVNFVPVRQETLIGAHLCATVADGVRWRYDVNSPVSNRRTVTQTHIHLGSCSNHNADEMTDLPIDPSSLLRHLPGEVKSITLKDVLSFP